jgi:hypothetical protein
VIAVVEDVAGGLIDGHGACLGRLLYGLATMNRQCGKVLLYLLVIRHRVYSSEVFPVLRFILGQNKTAQAICRGSLKTKPTTSLAVGSTETYTGRLSPNARTNACAAATDAGTTGVRSDQAAHESVHYINYMLSASEFFEKTRIDWRSLIRI